MPTSVSTRPAGTLNPTRRQLDELDALLQRMLELPVHPHDEPQMAEAEDAVEEPPPPFMEPPPPMAREKEMRPATPPISYMVVETASPRPLPLASGFETRRPRPMTPEPPAPQSVVGETPTPPKMLDESPSMPPNPVAEEGEAWVPLRSTWKPSAQTWAPLAESWHQANGGTLPPPPPATNQLPPLPDWMPVGAPPAATENPPAVPNNAPAATNNLPAADAMVTPAPAVDHSADAADHKPNEVADSLVNQPPPAAAEPLLSLSAEDAPVASPWPLLPLVWFNQGFDVCLAPLGVLGRWLCGPGRHLFGLVGLACLAAAAVVAACIGMGWNW